MMMPIIWGVVGAVVIIVLGAFLYYTVSGRKCCGVPGEALVPYKPRVFADPDQGIEAASYEPEQEAVDPRPCKYNDDSSGPVKAGMLQFVNWFFRRGKLFTEPLDETQESSRFVGFVCGTCRSCAAARYWRDEHGEPIDPMGLV